MLLKPKGLIPILEPKPPNDGCPNGCPRPARGLPFKFIDLRFLRAALYFYWVYFLRYSTSVGCS